MMKRLLIGIVAVWFAAIAFGHASEGAKKPKAKFILVELSVKREPKAQDWSGRAEISSGKILKVEKYHRGAADTINPDMSWNIIHARAWLSGKQPGGGRKPAKKGILLTVSAPDSAVLSFTTKGGDFSFSIADLAKGPIEKLDGNIRISIVKSRRQRRRGRRRGLPPAPIAGIIKATRISDKSRQSDFPSIACAADGTLWAAWVEWDGKSDRVLARQFRDKWQVPIQLSENTKDHYEPVLVASGKEMLCIWAAQVHGNWDLYSRSITPNGKLSKVERLTKHQGTDFNQRAAADSFGNVYLVWQSFRNGNSDIYLKRFANGKWSDGIRVSESPANDWQPSVADDKAGIAYIVWDSYDSGDYNVYLRTFSNGKLGPEVMVTTSPRAEFHASVACDLQGRAWVAWDEADQNWGKDFSGGSGVSAPGSRGLHHSRTLGLRVYQNGKLLELESGIRAGLEKILINRMSRYAELPHLATDGDGRVWIIFRHWTDTRPTETYHFYATVLTPTGWTTPWRLGNSQGRNTQRPGICKDKSGTLNVCYASDGRGPGVHPPSIDEALKYNIYVAKLPKPDTPPTQLTLKSIEPKRPAISRNVKTRYTTTLNGKKYILVYGDLHRHTDIRGHSGVDGSVLDTYRYALDAAALDFIGITDHNQVDAGRWSDGLRDYQWQWSQKAADLFFNPPTFIAMYSYEHSLGTPSGHRNIVYSKRGGHLRTADRRTKKDNQPLALWEWLKGQRVVDIPHTFADKRQPRAFWNWRNPKFEPLIEIYQGCRSSYEYAGAPKGQRRGNSQLLKGPHFAQDALRFGCEYGFIASSDHASTHNSYACVYVENLDRDGILDGLLARRTFAATDDIILDVTMGNHFMGEEFTTKTSTVPKMKIYAKANNEILRLDIVKNGKFIYNVDPDGNEYRGEFVDKNITPGDCYYYVRLIQRDVEAPNKDPEMAWSSPFFVKYE